MVFMSETTEPKVEIDHMRSQTLVRARSALIEVAPVELKDVRIKAATRA